jgi:hypothetical protein
MDELKQNDDKYLKCSWGPQSKILYIWKIAEGLDLTLLTKK